MPDLDVPTLPVLPLTTGVVLPSMVVTIAIETDEARAAVDAAASTGGRLLLVPRLDGRYASVGTVAQIEDAGDLRTGVRALVVRGLHRASLGGGVAGTGSALWLRAEPAESAAPTAEAERLATEYKAVLEGILNHRGAGRLVSMIEGLADPGEVADMAGYSPDLEMAQKVEVLETVDVEARLRLVLEWAKETLAELSIRDRIRQDVTDGMEKTQREYLLRQQLAAIRKELGDDEGTDDLLAGYRSKAEEPGVPDAVRTAILREVDRLERTPEQQMENGWIRTWLDTVTGLPWGVRAGDEVDVTEARAVLDADHTGLNDVKDRIVEYLAVRQRRADRVEQGLDTALPSGRGSGAIVTLVGPPGVGKTSLGESVARAMGRPFVRVALGGIRDEAEIRGHRRTYVGAMPGRIVRAIADAGAMNPVLMLDEVDKIGADWRGDPSSALLEVLDPAQNHTFRDHYLEVDLDLSDVVFIATANTIDTIPGPLFDRMEVVQLDGYTEDEKVTIARDHLLGRQLAQNGLAPEEVSIDDEALRAVVTGYTREAGVRGLERAVGKLLRKVATRLSAGELDPPVAIGADEVRTYLGRDRFTPDPADLHDVPGVATGLAVTGVGGDVLSIEVTSMPGDGGLTLTGQLGDVMKESATIALSYVRSHAAELGVPADAFEDRRFHVHVPAGAVPKDGPSAGVTMATALVSYLTGRPVAPGVGMTGEVTLQGKVLPIGGVKQKSLAAHRAGLTDVVLPVRNGPDLDDVPESVRSEVRFHLATTLADVLAVAFPPTGTEVPAAA
ncbi:MAG TPA: endopeptidase La [Acidimicrobiales bacterium]